MTCDLLFHLLHLLLYPYILHCLDWKALLLPSRPRLQKMHTAPQLQPGPIFLLTQRTKPSLSPSHSLHPQSGCLMAVMGKGFPTTLLPTQPMKADDAWLADNPRKTDRKQEKRQRDDQAEEIFHILPSDMWSQENLCISLNPNVLWKKGIIYASYDNASEARSKNF